MPESTSRLHPTLGDEEALRYFRSIRRITDVVFDSIASVTGNVHPRPADNRPLALYARTACGLIMVVDGLPAYLYTPWGQYIFHAALLFTAGHPRRVMEELAAQGIKLGQPSTTPDGQRIFAVQAVGDDAFPEPVYLGFRDSIRYWLQVEAGWAHLESRA